jgi:hypothetical protein
MKLGRIVLAAVLAVGAGIARASPPQLAVYVTDDNRDVYVALYEVGVGIELAGCPSAAIAAKLVGERTDAIVETTLGELQAERDLSHPKIPCGSAAPFDADFPATTPVWFDATETKRYYLASPVAADAVYSIPSACEGIRDAFAIRQRIALPGVLQASRLPPADRSRQIVLDCGGGAVGPVDPVNHPDHASSTYWTLHKADVFLTAGSIGDPIYVAVFNRVASSGVEKSYLPIHRINGAPAGSAQWEGGQSTQLVENALSQLFDIDPATQVTTLGFEDVGKLDKSVYLDLCLTRCDSYRHEHGYFPQPGVSVDLVTLPDPLTTQHTGLLGNRVNRWEFASGRAVNFDRCGALETAIGISAPASSDQDWARAMEEAAAAPAETLFECSRRSEVCVRTVADGSALTQSHLNRGPDCPSANRLRISLSSTTTIASRLVIGGNSFLDVEIAPLDPLGRSRIAISLQPVAAVNTLSCLVDPVPGIIDIGAGSNVRLARLDFVRSAASAAQELVWLSVDQAKAALDRVVVESAGDGLSPLERAIRLCHAELYVSGGSYRASLLGIHALRSRISVAGVDDATPATIVSNKFGAYLLAGSIARFSRANVSAPRALTLNDSSLRASRAALSTPLAMANSTALRLERGATAELSISSARGFSCVATFTDQSSSARFTLPVNALANDNLRVGCGLGAVEIIE